MGSRSYHIHTRVISSNNRTGNRVAWERETKSADPRWPVFRSGPARGPNPIRAKGSTCAPPPSSSPSLLPRQRTRDSKPEGELVATRREEPEVVPNQRRRKVGSGASQPAATMRRGSKKSSSSAATASAGNARPLDPSFLPLVPFSAR